MRTSSRFYAAVLTAALGLGAATGQQPVDKEKAPPVSGVYKGNGVEAKLAYLSATKGDTFADKPTTVLIFTEKDHSKDRMPRIKAQFGDYGSALIITVHPDGKVVGCEVAHASLKRSGFSSVGSIKMSDYKADGGTVRGSLATDGEVTTFGDKWEVKLKFEAKAP